MAFTFTDYAGIKPQASPFQDMLGKVLGGYGKTTQAKYLPKILQADIFHKTISPLAMLASSPFFMALHPSQQQQIASFISQQLGQQSGFGTGGQSVGQPQTGGYPQMAMPGQNTASQGGGYTGGQPTQSLDENGRPIIEQPGDFPDTPTQAEINGETLAPGTPGEHVLQTYSQSQLKPGVPHMTKSGQVVSTPTSTQVERQQAIISGTSKLGKIYNDYVKIGKEIADAGEIRRDISHLAGGIGKLPFNLAKKTEKLLGGKELAEKSAKFEDLKGKMKAGLKETGLLNNQAIDSILEYRGGESGEAFEKRLINNAAYINNLVRGGKDVLTTGFNTTSNIPTVPKLKTTALNKHVSKKMQKNNDPLGIR